MPSFGQLSNSDIAQWDAWEKGGVVGHIRYLYQFRIPGRNHDTLIHYCTGSDVIEYEGETYLPHPCKHDGIKRDASTDETTVSLAADALWLTMIFEGNVKKVDVVIRRYRIELKKAIVLFNGTVNQHSMANNVMSLSCISSYQAADAMLIVYYTQMHCNHDLYGTFCGLDYDAYKVKIPAGQWTVSGNRAIDLHGNYFLDQNYWKNCLVIYDVDITETYDDIDYTIVFETDNMAQSVGRNTLLLRYAVSSLVKPATTDLYLAPSCCLLLERCRDVMGNLPRACSIPDMPLSNPTTSDCLNKENKGGPFGPPGRSPYRFGKY